MTTGCQDNIAFPKLSETQMNCVAGLGELRRFEDGESLFSAGEKNFPFFVIKSGEVEITECSSGKTNLITVHTARHFTGDVDMITGRPSVVTASARGGCEAYALSRATLRRLLEECPDLSEMLLDAFQLRRQLLLASGFVGLRVVGQSQSKDTLRLLEFFYKNHVAHTFFDADEPTGRRQLEELHLTAEDLPAIACYKKVVRKPALGEVAECLGISRGIDEDPYDLIIVGAGPAGLAAAVSGASEGLKTLVVDRIGPGGQAGSSSKIENFIGFPSGVGGSELANRSYLQALKFGAQFTAPVTVQSLAPSLSGEHRLQLCTGQTARARTVLVASGVSYRRLEAEALEQLEGAGVYYAATSIEARACRSKPVVIVGGGNSAGQAAMFLAKTSSRVYLIIRGPDLSRGMSAYLCHRIRNHPQIEVLTEAEIEGLEGSDALRTVWVNEKRSGRKIAIDCGGVFIFIGAHPHSDWLPSEVRRDEKGYVVTGAALHSERTWPLDREPCDLETSFPGIFAAGDVRSGTAKRCSVAAGEGALAISCVHRSLNQL